MFRKLVIITGILGLGIASSSSVANAAQFNAEHQLKSSTAIEVAASLDHNLHAISDSGAGKGAEGFVQSMADRAIGFLSSSNMNETQKRDAFRRLLSDSFDMKTIGRFSLGRYWRASTPQQRQEYQSLFEKMIIEVYSSRFSEYKGQKFETRGNRTDGPKDTIVTSYLIPSDGPEVEVEWRIRYKNGAYKIVDVIVEGVSMSVTQRSDFSSVIQRGGGSVQVLIDHLRSL